MVHFPVLTRVEYESKYMHTHMHIHTHTEGKEQGEEGRGEGEREKCKWELFKRQQKTSEAGPASCWWLATLA